MLLVIFLLLVKSYFYVLVSSHMLVFYAVLSLSILTRPSSLMPALSSYLGMLMLLFWSAFYASAALPDFLTPLSWALGF